MDLLALGNTVSQICLFYKIILGTKTLRIYSWTSDKYTDLVKSFWVLKYPKWFSKSSIFVWGPTSSLSETGPGSRLTESGLILPPWHHVTVGKGQQQQSRDKWKGDHLTHWGRDKIDAILQTTFSNTISWMKMFEFRLKFHWSLFLKVPLILFQHWFR